MSALVHTVTSHTPPEAQVEEYRVVVQQIGVCQNRSNRQSIAHLISYERNEAYVSHLVEGEHFEGSVGIA